MEKQTTKTTNGHSRTESTIQIKNSLERFNGRLEKT